MPELLKRCPKCGSPNLQKQLIMATNGAYWRIVCDDCGHLGQASERQTEAIKLWNEEAMA